jgi:pimeloyl-ACP methyl ester carboxylesterase
MLSEQTAPIEAAQSQSMLPPSLALLLLEAPRTFLAASLLIPAFPLLLRAPRGDGHPVLVIPGFTASDISTQVIRRYVSSLGYEAYGWQLGRNLGLGGGLRKQLMEHLAELHERHDRRVSIVGWSLGGIYARELAKLMPNSVRRVITLGSPFGGEQQGFDPWMVRLLTGRDLAPRLRDRLNRMRPPPPVQSTAIFTRTDGIAPWRACREMDGDGTENIEVVASHCGLGFHPAVLYAIADRLAQPEGEFVPFDRRGLRSAFYG